MPVRPLVPPRGNAPGERAHRSSRYAPSRLNAPRSGMRGPWRSDVLLVDRGCRVWVENHPGQSAAGSFTILDPTPSAFGARTFPTPFPRSLILEVPWPTCKLVDRSARVARDD